VFPAYQLARLSVRISIQPFAFVPLEQNYIGAFVAVHRGGYCSADGFRCTPHWIRVEMRIAMRGRRLGVAEQLADDWKRKGSAGADARKAVAEVVDADSR
jgi:hypothetical protein